MQKVYFLFHVKAIVFLICISSFIVMDKSFCEDLNEEFSTTIERNIEELPPQLRLAFISGHVAAGIFLYKAGRLPEASKHLMHPASETHKAERVGLESEGLDIESFETISRSIQAGIKASQLAMLLKKAEENLLAVSNRITVDDKTVIKFLLETAIKEYKAGVPKGKIIANLGEYQDSWGFVVVARRHAEKLKAETRNSLIYDLDALLKNWSDGPLEVDEALPYEKMKMKITSILNSY
jgi:hypothetical protein